MRELRIAFTGPAGTGKSTLTEWIARKYNLEINPVGSRSVAAEMGFKNPYDVDAAGKRDEFQRKLLQAKRGWEKERNSFVTDRSMLDNVAYSSIHGVRTVDEIFLAAANDGQLRYTHIFYCPLSAFCHLDNDPQRHPDLTYHHIYDALLFGLHDRFPPRCYITTLSMSGLEERQYEIDSVLRPPF